MPVVIGAIGELLKFPLFLKRPYDIASTYRSNTAPGASNANTDPRRVRASTCKSRLPAAGNNPAAPPEHAFRRAQRIVFFDVLIISIRIFKVSIQR
jgi:hypothetical protein